MELRQHVQKKKLACILLGGGGGAVPASREGMGIRGDRKGVLTPGMLTPVP